MKIRVSNRIFVQDITSGLNDEMVEKLTFINLKWLENDRLGYCNGRTPRYLRFYEIDNGVMITPRGFERQLIGICKSQGISYEIEDNRLTLPEVKFSFNGTLRPFQEDAVKAMLKRDFGILDAPTGSGKTVMALKLIVQRRQSALVVVHTKELLHQWISRIETFLGIPAKEVSVIANGKVKYGQR